MSEQANFELWAIVELMGHRKLAGKVSEEIHFGTPLLRIDVPTIWDGVLSKEIPGFTTFYGGQSIYSLTPCSQEIAVRYATYHRERPVQSYELPQLAEASSAVAVASGQVLDDGTDNLKEGDYEDDEEERMPF